MSATILILRNRRCGHVGGMSQNRRLLEQAIPGFPMPGWEIVAANEDNVEHYARMLLADEKCNQCSVILG